MKIEKVMFKGEMPIPKVLPGYGGSTSGIQSDRIKTVYWTPGDDFIRVEVGTDPDNVTFFPLSQVANLYVRRAEWAEVRRTMDTPSDQPPGILSRPALREQAANENKPAKK